MDGSRMTGPLGIDEDAAVSTTTQRQALPLYATRIKVYPKQVRGLYRRIKWAMLAACLLVYYLVPWIRWDRGPGAPDQAILIDLPGRRAYFFWLEIWPQEVYYVTGLLILAAIGLFLVTSLLGRVWCGYTCPQTVWTDLFLWVERIVEGDRYARIRLDRAPFSLAKAGRKILKHTIWLWIAAGTGGAWIMYFRDAPTVVEEILTFKASSAVYLFFGMFTGTTYLLAGWAREQVCTFMCPWPRFQAAMLDEDSLTVTYESWRGEPRGKYNPQRGWEGRGDCVNCTQCVAACPTGIDIRDGQQLECIGCGLCIDACNQVMSKFGRPPNLITFDTLSNQEARAAGRSTRVRLIRPRTLIYAGLLTVVASIMLVALLMRPSVEITVQRDRSPLFVTLSDGSIQNGYTFKILNKTPAAHTYTLVVAGVPEARLSVVGTVTAEGQSVEVSADRDTVETYRVYVRAPRKQLGAESTPLTFRLTETKEGNAASYTSVFLAPAR